MNIVDYFDCSNPVHRDAYKFLEQKGCWPEEFWKKASQDGVTADFSSCWSVALQAKLFNFYREFYESDVIQILEAGRIALNSVEQLNLGFQMDISEEELSRLRQVAEKLLN